MTSCLAGSHPFSFPFEQQPTWISESPLPCASLLVALPTQPKATATHVSPLVLRTMFRPSVLPSPSLVYFDPLKTSRFRASMLILTLTSEPARLIGRAAGAWCVGVLVPLPHRRLRRLLYSNTQTSPVRVSYFSRCFPPSVSFGRGLVSLSSRRKHAPSQPGSLQTRRRYCCYCCWCCCFCCC